MLLKHFFRKLSVFIIFNLTSIVSAKSLIIDLKTTNSLFEHPIVKSEQMSPSIKNLLFPSLLKFDEDWKIVCSICEKQPTFENGLVEVSRSKRSSGKISVKLILKKEATWGDGVSISGHDIAFSWKLGAAYSQQIKNPTIYDRIESVSVPRGKPKTAVILLRGAFFQNKILDGFRIIPRHLEQPIWAKSGKKINRYIKASFYKVAPDKPGLYHSNYTVVKTKAGSLTIHKNSKTDPGPEIQHVTLKKTESFESWASNSPGKNSVFINEDYSNPQFKSDENRFAKSALSNTHKRLSTPTTLWEQAVFNQRNPILTDKKVRKAILHAINWSNIGKLIGHNNLTTSPTFEPPFSPNFKPFEPNIYSPTLSHQLLKAAGWIKHPGSKHYIKDDQKLEFNMVVLKNNDLRVKIADMVKNDLLDIGFHVSLYPKSKSYLMNRVIKEGRFTGLAFYGIKMETNLAPRTLFHSQEIPSSINDYLGQNVGVWYSKDVDTSLDRIRLSLSARKRKENYQTLQTLFYRDIPSISLFFHKDFSIVPKALKVKGYVQGENILSSLASWEFEDVPFAQKKGEKIRAIR